MTEIIAETSHYDYFHIMLINLKLSLLSLLKMFHHRLRHKADAERVLEASVNRTGVDIVDRAELLDLSQSLELWRVHHVPKEGIEGNLVVHVVFDVACCC